MLPSQTDARAHGSGYGAGAIGEGRGANPRPFGTYGPAALSGRVRLAGGEVAVFAHLPVRDKPARADRVAHDGVACPLCHQITDANLGTAASFTGGYILADPSANRPRAMFGRLTRRFQLRRCLERLDKRLRATHWSAGIFRSADAESLSRRVGCRRAGGGDGGGGSHDAP
jgi:hypothetical protein